MYYQVNDVWCTEELKPLEVMIISRPRRCAALRTLECAASRDRAETYVIKWLTDMRVSKVVTVVDAWRVSPSSLFAHKHSVELYSMDCIECLAVSCHMHVVASRRGRTEKRQQQNTKLCNELDNTTSRLDLRPVDRAQSQHCRVEEYIFLYLLCLCRYEASFYDEGELGQPFDGDAQSECAKA